MECEISSAEAMLALGARLGTLLGPGDLLLLTGELGAGKTTLTQGIAHGLGIARSVTSPTFVTVKPYTVDGLGDLYHVDLYRVSDPDYLEDQGVLEELDRGAVVIVEWADRSRPLLEFERLSITILVSDKGRRLIFEASPSWHDRLEALR